MVLHFIMRKKGEILQDFFYFFLIVVKNVEFTGVLAGKYFAANVKDLLFRRLFCSRKVLGEGVVIFDGREVVG